LVENNLHLEIVEFCATRKINVIFEKPLADTVEHALSIRKPARKYGIQVMTNYQMAWSRPPNGGVKLNRL